MFRLGLAIGLISAFLSPSVLAQNRTSTERSCQKFVQSFYDWYVPKATDRNLRGRAWDVAVKQKPNDFGAQLLNALRSDSVAQDKSNELVGLDFDPFLSSQDPSERFLVTRTRVSGKTCDAEVHGISSGAQKEQVFPVLKEIAGHWVIVNFSYKPGTPSLLAILKNLAKDRDKK